MVQAQTQRIRVSHVRQATRHQRRETEKYHETLKAVETITIYRLQYPRNHLSTNWYSDPMCASINWKHVVDEYRKKDTE